MTRCPILLAALLLTACGDSSPVARNAVAPPDNMVGDAPGQGLAAPANAAAAESAQQAAMPAATDGMLWTGDATAARFGPSATNTVFSIECAAGMLVIRRVDAGPAGAKGTISFTGNGHAASLPAVVAGDGLTALWQAAQKPSDSTNAVARVFDGPGPVDVALAGTTALVLPASPLPDRPFDACASPTKRAAPKDRP